MKPISLEMYGFMTYKNKTFIDFTKLYDSKIFIISGDTGSGKTSIFDAISFALFNKVQREGFDNEDIRSDFLNGYDKPTYVDFSFEVDGKNYRIKRIPKQIAKKTRANVSVSHSVEFYKVGNNNQILISDKVNETESAVTDILGLDFNQLNKVMILAQGEFSKFLKSNSEQKASILSKIFSSYIYKDIEEKLKEASKDSRKNLEIISNKLDTEIKKNELLDKKIDKDLIELKKFDQIDNIIEKLSFDIKKDLEEKERERRDIFNSLEDISLRLNFYTNENQQIKIYKDLKNQEKLLLIDEDYYKNLKNDIEYSKKALTINPYYQNLLSFKESKFNYEEKISKNQEEIEFIEEKLCKLKREFKDRKALEGDIEKRKENIIRNKNLLERFKDLKKIKISLDKNKKAYQDFKSYERNIEELKEKKDNINENLRKASENLINIGIKLDQIKDKSYKESERIIKYRNLYERASENDKKINNLLKLQEQIIIDQKSLEKSQKLLEKAESLKESILINKFRKEIEKEGICPICGKIYDGKIEFLEIYDLDEDEIESNYLKLKTKINFEKEKIENLEKEISKDLDKSYIYEEKISNIKTNYKNLKLNYKKIYQEYKNEKSEKEELDYNLSNIKKQLENYRLKLNIYKNIEDIDKLKSKYKLKKEELKEYDEKNIIEKLKEDKSFVNDNEALIKKLEDEINNLENEESSEKARLISNKSYTKEIEEKIIKEENKFLENLEENFENFEKFLNYLENSHEIISKKEKVKKYFEDLKALNIKLEGLSKYENMEEYELTNLKSKKANLDKKKQNLDDFIFSLKLKLSKLSESQKEISYIRQDLDKSKNEDATLYKLSKIADGSLSKVEGREKLNFETFVLSYYFQKILSFANIRLKEMTDGQFTMLRKRQTKDKRKNYGLDIEILDANTGKIRSEASLSGGESFIASLALALGLSDEISQENGGIKIDTLFIDEGFGTLSDDYLEKAIRTIEKLSYDNKFIGLISHVKELKDVIDAKIEVSYSKTQGSNLKVIV